METGLFFPLSDEEVAQVREAIRANGQPDTPEGRRSWLLARVRATPTTRPNLVQMAADFARTPEGKAVVGLAKNLLIRRATP